MLENENVLGVGKSFFHLLENLRIVGGFDESLIVELRVFEPERPIVELKSMHFEGEGGPGVPSIPDVRPVRGILVIGGTTQTFRYLKGRHIGLLCLVEIEATQILDVGLDIHPSESLCIPYEGSRVLN